MCTWATLCPLLSTISSCSHTPLCFLKKKSQQMSFVWGDFLVSLTKLLSTNFCPHGSTLSLPELTEQQRRWKEEPSEPHCEQSWFQDGHTTCLGFTSGINQFWVVSFPLQNFLNVNLNLWGYKALCCQNTKYWWGQEWVLEQHMEDAIGGQYSLIKPKITPPQTLGE